MKHGVKFNRALVWDYEISEEDLESEGVFIFYLSRVLNNGCFRDIAEIPVETIEKYMGKLHLSSKVRRFWEWYLRSDLESPKSLEKEQ